MIPQHDLAVIKEWAQIIGLFAVIFSLLRAAYEIKENRKQRDTELLWKKINTAKELLNDIHTHDLAKLGRPSTCSTGAKGTRTTR
jgi:hypothetical protein